MTKLDDAGRLFDTPAGKALWKIVMLIFGAIVTAFLVTINGNLEAAAKAAAKAQATAEAVREHNYAQDQDIALLKVKADAIERRTDQAIATLQALTVQVTRNGDAIEHSKGKQK